MSGLPYALPLTLDYTPPPQGLPYTLPFSVGALDQLANIEAQCNKIRADMMALRQAAPYIRIWMNNPDGSGGAVYVGRVDYMAAVKGSFPFKNNVPTQGILQLRDDDYIAVFLKQIPNNSELKKNIIITVDFYGGQKRWSGLLDKWNVRSRDVTKYLEVTFNDDLTQLQYLLCPPNPLLPLEIFQFPRDFMLAGPAKWCISMIILLNLIRVEGNLWTLPDDPFDFNSWLEPLDWTSWQCYIKADPWLLDDSSLWTFLASRMNPIDSVIADALDDAQLTITYRRIITDDGETANLGPLVPNVKNGALVLEVVDNSNISVLAGTPFIGTYLQGTAFDGFARSVLEYVGGFFEDTINQITDNQSLYPDEYYQEGFLGTIASHPWLVIRDNEWTPIESADLSWGPSKAPTVVIGGDNPALDAIAKLVIETTANLLGYILLGGFSAAGQIAAELIMPFIVGTLGAWLHWKNTGRATELGWIHYWETFQAGADNNVWSMSALAAMRGGFLAGKSETDHLMSLHDSWVMPGVHFDVGHRIGGTVDSAGIQGVIWVNQVDEFTAAWDNSGEFKPYAWEVKVGRSNRNMSLGERFARLTKKFSEAVNNIGVKLTS